MLRHECFGVRHPTRRERSAEDERPRAIAANAVGKAHDAVQKADGRYDHGAADRSARPIRAVLWQAGLGHRLHCSFLAPLSIKHWTSQRWDLGSACREKPRSFCGWRNIFLEASNEH